MKKTILVFASFTCFLFSYSQKTVEKRCDHFKFVLECPVYKCDIFGNQLDTFFVISEVGAQFTLIYQDEEICIIRFKDDKKDKRNRTVLGSKNMKYYKLSKAEFEYKVALDEYKKWSLAVGNAIAPIKLRFSPFAFSKDFSIGPTFGARYTRDQSSVMSCNLLSSFGISSITLDSYNTKQSVEDPQEVIAFTSSLGVMLEHKAFQLGIFIGFDLLNNNNSYAESYIYNRRPWMSIGFGYSLFNNPD